MNDIKLRFISDSGHGWLEVPIAIVKELDISREISHCSYFNKDFIYLEEDVDARLFIDRFSEKHGFIPEIEEVLIDGESEIRGYKRIGE